MQIFKSIYFPQKNQETNGQNIDFTMKQLLFIATIFILFAGCCNKTDIQSNSPCYNELSLPELVNEVLRTSDTCELNKLYKQLNDSIISGNDDIWFSSALYINPDQNNVFLSFEKEKELLIDENSLYEINIISADSVSTKFKGAQISNITQHLNQYLSVPNILFNCNKDKDRSFSEYEQPNPVIVFLSLKNKETGMDLYEYDILFKNLKMLVAYYNDKLNEISFKRWGVRFNLLCLDKKIYVSKCFQFKIFVGFPPW